MAKKLKKMPTDIQPQKKNDLISYTEPTSSRPLNNASLISSPSLQKLNLKSKLSIIHFDDDDEISQKKNIEHGKPFFQEFLNKNQAISINLDNFENHENKYSDNLSRRDFSKKKRSVTFADLPNIANMTLKKTNTNFQKCSQESEIMRYIILKKQSFPQKMLFFCKKFVTSHIISGFFSLLFIAIQNKYSKYCFMPPNCLCHDDIVVKIYTAFKEFFSYWIIYIMAIIQAVFLKDFFQDKTNKFKIFFFLTTSLSAFLFVVFSKENYYYPVILYAEFLILVFILELYFLLKIKSFKKAIFDFLQINQVGIVIFVNYIFYAFFYKRVNDAIIESFPDKFSQNIINLYISIYTLIVTYILKIFVINYSVFLIKTNKRNTYAIISMMRISLCLFMSIPAANLVKMKIDDWGGWVLLFSYGNFLLGFYFKIDIANYIFSKVKKCFRAQSPRRLSRESVKNYSYVKKLFSGCVLDVQLICCFRIIILYLSNRWFGAYTNGIYYKDCSFEINEDAFEISQWGFIALILINTILALFIFFYMIKMKNLLILYKIKHNFLYNVYFLFLTHCYFEANLNMFYL